MKNKITSAFLVFLTIAVIVICITSLPARGQASDEKTAEIARIFKEGVELSQTGTAESLQASLVKLDQARHLAREAKDKDSEAICLLFIGKAYDSMRDTQKALENYNQALRLFQTVVDNKGFQSITLNYIGKVYAGLNEHQKALEYYYQALPLSQTDANNPGGEALILNNIGMVYANLGEQQKAIEYLTKSLALFRVINDKHNEGLTLNNLGLIYGNLGENRKALEYFTQSLALRRAAGDKRGEAQSLINIGTVLNLLGEKQKALEYLNQALPLIKPIGDKVFEAELLDSMGLLYAGLGERRKALEYFLQALPLRLKASDTRGEAITLTNIGATYNLLGEKQKALEYFNRSLPLFRAMKDKRGEAHALYNIGLIYFDSVEMLKSLDNFNLALPLTRDIGDKALEAVILNALAAAYDMIGLRDKAVEYYKLALLLRRIIGNKGEEAETLHNLMIAFNKTLNPRYAVLFGKQSVNAYQQLRANIGGLDKNLRQSYLKSIESTYRELAEILIKNNRLAEAQQILNLFKDQQYFDFISAGQSAPLALTPREAEFISVFNKKLDAAAALSSRFDEQKRAGGNRKLTDAEAGQLKQIQSDFQKASDDYQRFLKQTTKEFASPPDDKDKIPAVADTRQMQTALLEINGQTGQKAVAVYVLVGEEKLSTLIIPPEGEIKSVSYPIKSKVLNEKALKLWALLQSDKYDTTKLSKQLYDVVFKPLEAHLPKDTTTIMWSLDGNLRYVPMAALYDGEKFLVERYSNVVFTRADKERMTRPVSPVWTGVGFGSSQKQTVEVLGEKISLPALPGVTQELETIFRQNNSSNGVIIGEVFPDAKFNKANFLKALKQKRPLVHISSHFSFRPGDEARSFLLLGDGSPFTLEDIKREANLFEGVELLTLSACNTAAQQSDANGREIDGFAELAQRLGAGAVIATLWQVPDVSTPWLMRDFYANRQDKSGMTKAEALQKAQIALLNGTAKIKPLTADEKDTSPKVEIVIVPQGANRNAGSNSNNNRTGSDVIYLDESDAPLYKREGKPAYAHPYYWSPFILIGNWL